MSETALNRAIRRVEKLRADTERNQLINYCAFVLASEIDPNAHPNTCIGYSAALELPADLLRRLFEEDDWGQAWNLMDGEHTEYHENDEGALRSFQQVLDILHEEANA